MDRACRAGVGTGGGEIRYSFKKKKKSSALVGKSVRATQAEQHSPVTHEREYETAVPGSTRLGAPRNLHSSDCVLAVRHEAP